MPPHPQPEILRLSLADLALRVKMLPIFNDVSIESVFNQALDPPLEKNLQRAISSLIEVFSLRFVSPRTSFCSHLGRGSLTSAKNNFFGKINEQATGGCASGQVSSDCNHFPMPRCCAYYLLRIEFEAIVSGTYGAGCRS